MDDLIFDDDRPIRATRTTEPDFATLIGVVIALGLVIGAIVLGGEVLSFFDFNSLLIVVGGTVGATLITFSAEDLQRAGAVVRQVMYEAPLEADVRVRTLTEISRRARSDGLLALEHHAFRERDPFLRKGLQLLVDGFPADAIERTLKIDLDQAVDRHRRGALIFQTMGTLTPAMGLVGTLIGLVQMLRNLEDPSKIGPGMATALLTTFYGAFLAYLVLLPIAAKLRNRSADEAKVKLLTIEGLVSIAKEMNPRLVEQQLQLFLPPDHRFGTMD